MHATTIQEVIVRLNEIIAWCKVNENRMGYFATMYCNTTVAVQYGIENNYFEDGPRMEKLDVIFANLYLEAFDCYTNGKPCSKSWKTVFDHCKMSNYTVLQHLLTGMGTHINVDLAIATEKAAAGTDIFLLQSDFNKINDIIASLTQSMYSTLSQIWLPLKWILKGVNNRHDVVVNFSISRARQAAWANAVALSMCNNEEAKQKHITIIDNGVSALTLKILNPGLLIKMLLQPVLLLESKKVGYNIGLLQNGLKHSIQ